MPKWWMDAEFITGFLIFVVIRPAILIFALAVFGYGVVDAIWGS